MKNTYLSGILIGIIAPLVAFLIAKFTTFQEHFLTDKPLAIYVVAAMVNLIIFRFTHRAGKDLLAKGVLLATFIAMLGLIFGTGIKI